MLKRFLDMLGARYFHREPRRKKELKEDPMSMDASAQEDLSVRIIHAGGLVERYQGVVHVGRVLEKYPTMCVARPEVFKQPHKSLVKRDEYLLPGQKFYLVPRSTVKKLKCKYPEKLRVGDKEEDKGLDGMGGKKIVDAEDSESFEESVCSAKDFYVSRERWSKCVQRCRMGGMKPFTPPIKKVRMWQPTGWQPSLDSVEELSP